MASVLGVGGAAAFVEIPLEPNKRCPNLLRAAEVGNGVGDRVVVAQAQ